ncbi:putative tubulin-tyrosine ligase family protein [Neospora caninum Liverpool]|uniref:Tubulin--tyrosine ligase-like protein 9 n=1 Tax=Neospora caninum (strain Liverpool) TaxID=572307 RepID=F0VRD5_NEOCL|nr:putative tubulin-tyrosine ligase family protein [Neospora caninum Liverpool]CBZ56283.1 putative tubulin-tyrosine ligase family protein [Neospora caninum Liverpool]|eukprot:XP_003886308.1 putative tubulin-tyrosine ligase family protein [Neospora caninum Liverpool]
MFVEEFRKSPNTLWIMKPIGRSQGKGIFLFERLSQIREEIRSSPLRLRHFIFTSRNHAISVLGECAGMHLTNVAIQRFSENYDEEFGGKWSLRNVKQFLITKYGEARVNELMLQIQQLMLKPLIAVSKVMINDKHCFELYGYDIIIDAHLKPWLLEVNASPSLTASTPLDYNFKIGLLDDVLTIVDMEKYLAGDEKQIGGFVLLYKGGPVNEMPVECTTLSYLGTDIAREACLKYLGKKLAAHRSDTAGRTNCRANLAAQLRGL